MAKIKTIPNRTIKMVRKEDGEKKHSYVYKAADGVKDPFVDSVYVSKLAFGGDGEYPPHFFLSITTTEPKAAK